MGWTSYRATHYKKGTVDRKAECDNLFNSDMVTWDKESKVIGKFEVLKSCMVGSTYYAAIKRTTFATETEPEESAVHGLVCLTSVNMKDYFNFSYKDMSESMGPYQHNCPKGILDLLSPTDSEWANEWRKKCYENLKAKKDPNNLNNLPVGTVIEVVMPFDTKYHTKGDKVRLTKEKSYYTNRTAWYKGAMKFTAGLMQQLNGHYTIIKTTQN